MGIFKAYDVRGIYGDNLTEKEAYLIAYYIVKFLKLKDFKVAHDCRLSHEQLTKFFIQGLIDANCNVIYLGKSSTPNFYFSLFDGVNSGVTITASHNSKEYNGFKFMIDMTSFDSRNGLYDLEKLVNEDLDNKEETYEIIKESISSLSLKNFLEDHEIVEDSSLDSYVDYLVEFYRRILNDKEREILKSLKIGFDFANGMTSLAMVPFLDKLKINNLFANENLDGSFPVHEPDPLKSKEFVANHDFSNCDLICAFDGDGDRVCFYDEDKKFVMPDFVMATYIDYFKSLGKNFVVDLRASQIISDIANENNLNLKLMRVGRSFYQDYLVKEGCIFGGELSGHLFFKDFRNLDNADISVIFMLKIIAKEMLKLDKGKFKFSNLINKYIKYHRIPETNLVVSDAQRVFDVLEEKFGDKIVMRVDGLSFNFESYWFNVRKSNTEPKIRINFEGQDEKTTEEEFNKLLNLIKSI